MIAIGLSPNTQKDDVLLALTILLTPWRWVRGHAAKTLEDWFRRFTGRQFAIAFDSGRSAEYAILKAIGVGVGDEVLIQAFTCVAVPNSILWNGATPVYVDVNTAGNLDPKDLERKVTERSRAIIVQHTFGIPADIDAIKKVAKTHRLILIEDCAHALGATVAGKKVGTFGEFAFFSFGRDKVVSSVAGGMAVTNSKKHAKILRSFQRNLGFPSLAWIFAQVLHPIAFVLILPTYNLLSIGKFILIVLQKLRFLTKPVARQELTGGRPPFYPRKLPNAQALLALHQVQKIITFNKRRREIASVYDRELRNLPMTLPAIAEGDIFLRYNVEVQNPNNLYRFMRGKGMLLGRWYSHVIDPKDVDLGKIGYVLGSCPKAETLAQTSLNLPTYPRMTVADAEKVVEVLKEYFRKDSK